MKTLKKALSILLCLTVLFALTVPAFAAEDTVYTIISPYADVIWEGENAWGAYKGNLHSHSTYSDASEDLATMVKEYYEQDFDFLAKADHGVTGVEWNKDPARLPLYAYQSISGKKVAHLTDEEFEGITSGTYPLYDGTVRGDKMVCVTGANELNNLTLTKSHVNGYFLPANKGNGFGGTENGFEDAIAFVEKNGGISHINHPGDWLDSNGNIDAVSDEKSVKFLSELILKYPTCMGIEVFNERNSTDPYNRILWDNMLMYTLPYGRNIIGFSNNDAHNIPDIDTSFSVFMMEENTVDNIKATMQSGAFFPVTRILRANDVIGPKEDIDARNTDIPYPLFTSVKTEGHTVKVTAENADTIQWIADGKVIATADITNDEYTLNLDEIEGAERFLYIRAELFGEGGVCLTQALTIDNGSEPLTWEESSDILEEILFRLKSTRFWTILVELWKMIIDELS